MVKDLKINSARIVDIVLDIEDAFEIEIDNQSLAKIKKACSEPKEKVNPVSTEKVSVVIPADMKAVITDIQVFLGLTPANQYKVRQFMFNLPICQFTFERS